MIRSDEFLTLQGVEKARKIVHDSSNTKSPLKVCILGGAHSAFSSAWLLLNGPLSLDHHSHDSKNLSECQSKKHFISCLKQ